MKRQGCRILAVSSGGGHWVQLLRLRPAFTGHEVIYATVSTGYRPDVPDSPFIVIPDATRWEKARLVWCAVRIFALLLRLRPDVIISTGAAPGYMAVRLGKWFGARTIWVDSLANVERLSMAGLRVGNHVDLWLTQWPQLAREGGPRYYGSVL